MCSKLEKTLESNRLRLEKNIEFYHKQGDKFDENLLWQLSFIGCILISREHWINIDAKIYHGCYFSHIASIFNTSKTISIMVISKPVISIRINNETWRSNHLKLWHYYWPRITSMISKGFTEICKDVVIDDISFRVILKYYILNKLENTKVFKMNLFLIFKIKFVRLLPKNIIRSLSLLYAQVRNNSKLEYIIKETSIDEKI